MIIEAGGGKGGFKEYLENGVKAGRDFHRNELDQRVPLVGDLDVFELATSLHQGDGRTYDHITLSFSERHVTNEMLEIAVNEFLDHALFAWPTEDRNRVPVYAEAHRPKLQSYINSETGEDVERFIHIHVGMGRHDLLTGKAIEPLGFLGPKTDNLKYLDAWQESFNAKHGFSSPKDNPRITPENAIDVIARYSGKKPDELGSQNSKKAAFEIVLQKEIIAQNVTSWEDFHDLLAVHGVVSTMNRGRFDECYRIKLPNADKAMRLKGVFFQRQFIERSTTEKIEILSGKAKVAYLEQMQPRKEPHYVAGILAEWHTKKAKELRYLNTGSPFYKNVYLPADTQTRLQIINELERKDHGIKSPSTRKVRKITPARNRVPGMPIRNLDGIQRRTEMLLRGDAGMDVRAEFKGRKMGVELRQADGRARGRIGGGSDETDAIHADLYLSREIGGRGGSYDAGRHEDTQPRDGAAGYSASGWVKPMGRSAAIAPPRGDLHLQEEGWDGGKTGIREAQKGRNDRIRIVGEVGEGQGRHSGRLFEGNQLVQSSSVLARVQADMLDRYEHAEDKEKYAEIRENIDCMQLLSRLSHSHGLNPILYPVTTAKDGTPRIQCGSRSLSPSDFLMKELGLPWKDAAPILRQTYEHQLGKRVTTVRENAAPAALRREFKADQLAGRPAIEQRLQEFDAETKRQLALLFSRLKIEQTHALAGLTGASKKAAQSLSKLSSATAKAEFNDERRALRKAIQPTQAHAWRVFLQSRAQAGSEEALATLRKLDDTARATPAQSIGTIYLNDEDEKTRRLVIKSTSFLLKQLVHVVETNGDITYSQHGHAVLRDEGMRLAVLDPNSKEAIAAGLMLAREKFGTDLTLTGSPEFQRRVVEVAVAQGIQIKFVDPQLEAMRLQLTKEKRQAAHSPMPEKVIQAPPDPGETVAQAGHQAEPSHSAEAALPTPSNKSAQRGIEPGTGAEQRMQRAMAARALVKETTELAAQAEVSSKKKEAKDAAAERKTSSSVAPVIVASTSNQPEDAHQTVTDAAPAPLELERVAAPRKGPMTGTVKAVDGCQFALAKNREGDLVWHHMDNLPGSDLPKVGEIVNVDYVDGVGKVAVKGKNKGLGR